METVQVKTSELSGVALDWAVAKCEGVDHILESGVNGIGIEYDATNYSTDWSQGGTIIEREGISVLFCAGDLGEPRSYWAATTEQQFWGYGYGPYHEQDDESSIQIYKHEIKATGETPLIAAMRCYVASKLGDNVEVPSELF